MPRPTVSLEDVLVAAQAFNYAQHYAEVVSVTTNAGYPSGTTPRIDMQVIGEAGVDSLVDLFHLGHEADTTHPNYTRRGEFQGRSVEVYSGRSES